MGIISTITNFFQTNGFMPHGMCLLWKPSVLWTMVLGNALIALSYFTLPLALLYLITKRRDIGFKWIFVLFGAFIFFCGLTHVMSIITLWTPMYGLEGLVLVFTGIVSLLTAILIWPLLPSLFKMPSPWLLEKTNTALDQSNKELEKLNKIKTQFFANVSHELRTPLMLILGPLENLLSNPKRPVPYLKELSLIEANARILLKHVNDLLDIAKLEADKMQISYHNVDLAKLTHHIVSLFEERIQVGQIKLELELPKQMPAQIDSEKIQRALINLLSNAIKCTPPKGYINITLISHKTHASLMIKDSGPGVPPAYHEAIFERFFQVEDGSARQYEGSGLGLAITKEFIELHGGSIKVSNAPQGGTLFTIDLPLQAPKGTTVAAQLDEPVSLEQNISPYIPKEIKSKPTHREQGKLNNQDATNDLPLILVVEDNVDMNEFVCDILSKNYRIESAFDGQEGLQKALHLRPDLIVSDIMMPYMNGVELVHEIRRQAPLLTTPIIILTAKADDKLCVEMLREGAQDYMIKPFSPDEFRARVMNLIRTKKVDNELEKFVYHASHDLKAPLLGMQYLINWIEEDNPGNQLTNQSKKHLELLRRRAYRMGNLLDSLLKYYQIGRIQAEISSVNSKQLVQDIVRQLNPPTTFTFEYAKNLPVLQTSKALLHQVFSAILDNSIKYTSRKNGHIKVGIHELSNFYEFFVEDNGPGIESVYHSKIFELFQTLQPRDILESSGVGLSIAKKIVESQGGEITVDSAKNKGATFRFTWPKYQEKIRSKQPAS